MNKLLLPLTLLLLLTTIVSFPNISASDNYSKEISDSSDSLTFSVCSDSKVAVGLVVFFNKSITYAPSVFNVCTY